MAILSGIRKSGCSVSSHLDGDLMAAPRGAFAGILEGFDASVRLFDKYHKDVEQGFQEEMEYWAQRILSKSLIYCPTSEGGDYAPSVEPGFLRSTGQVV